MDDKNVQNENLMEKEPILENAPSTEEAPVVEEVQNTPEAEVVDTTVMPKNDFEGYVQEETVITIKKEKEKNGLAVASMVCGIVGAVFGVISCLCCCWPLSVISSILAIIFAFVDRSKKGSFNGKTIAGLVCGIIGVVAPIVVLVVDFFLQYGGNFDLFIEAVKEGMEQGMAE